MDERAVRAILALMNLSAPKGTEWCAWQPDKSYVDEMYLIREHWRFYLVEDESSLHENSDGSIVWGA